MYKRRTNKLSNNKTTNRDTIIIHTDMNQHNIVQDDIKRNNKNK